MTYGRFNEENIRILEDKCRSLNGFSVIARELEKLYNIKQSLIERCSTDYALSKQYESLYPDAAFVIFDLIGTSNCVQGNKLIRILSGDSCRPITVITKMKLIALHKFLNGVPLCKIRKWFFYVKRRYKTYLGQRAINKVRAKDLLINDLSNNIRRIDKSGEKIALVEDLQHHHKLIVPYSDYCERLNRLSHHLVRVFTGKDKKTVKEVITILTEEDMVLAYRNEINYSIFCRNNGKSKCYKLIKNINKQYNKIKPWIKYIK